MFLLAVSYAFPAFSQEVPAKNWDLEKIRGTRYVPYHVFQGLPFLTNTWVLGKIELTDGVGIDSLSLRYSSYEDQLLYYNNSNGAQIEIDKSSLNGFAFKDADGKSHVFRKQYYDKPEKGERFFEVLSGGETDLLAYRKVNLNMVSAYKDEQGVLKNMAYVNEYCYYLYSPQKGYVPVKMNHEVLMSKFDKISRTQIRKLLRKHRISVNDEESFVRAWSLIEKEGYRVAF
jgi:hypothetical protein